MSSVARIPRAVLAELTRNERLIRYLEGLAQEIDDSRPLSGAGSPEGVIQANDSRLYRDTATGELWLNNHALPRQSTGWINKG